MVDTIDACRTYVNASLGHTTPKFSLYLTEAEKTEQSLSEPGLVKEALECFFGVDEVVAPEG